MPNVNKINYHGTEYDMTAKSIYSTTEQKIGTWIDNLPLYRKVVHLTSGWELGAEKTINHGISNVKEIVDYRGCYLRSDNKKQIIPNTHLEIEKWSSACYDFTPTSFFLYIGTLGGVFTINSVDITLYYTKTTDVVE